MVRALLAGTKTVTRRLVKPRQFVPGGGGASWDRDWKSVTRIVADENGDLFPMAGDWNSRIGHMIPPYMPGVKIWVKEGLRAVIDTTFDQAETMPIAAYASDGAHIWEPGKFRLPWRWKNSTLPGMFMPRSVCRLILEVVGVRVERLQDITEGDARLEGFSPCTFRDGRGVESALLGFRRLWETLNGKAHPWDSNPWVWRIEFSRINNSEPAIAIP